MPVIAKSAQTELLSNTETEREKVQILTQTVN